MIITVMIIDIKTNMTTTIIIVITMIKLSHLVFS